MIGIKEDHSDSCSSRLGGCWHPCLRCPKRDCWRPILPQHQLDLWARVKSKLGQSFRTTIADLPDLKAAQIQTEKSSGTLF